MDKNIIIISGINIVDGGALSVFKDFLNCMVSEKKFKSYHVIILVSRIKIFQEFESYFEIKEFPKSKEHWIKRLYYEYFYFYFYSRKIKPLIWISMHDITPNVIAKKRFVYCHNPSPFYNMSIKEAKYGFKYFLFSKFYKYLYRINIKKNTSVIVQQNWMAKEFKKMYNIGNIIVAKPSFHLETIVKKSKPKNKEYKFLYPSFARPYKNFELACEAAKELWQKNKGFKLFITISGNENLYARMLKKKYGGLTYIVFTGLLKRSELLEMYGKVDCLLFLSKLETWGMPITEFKAFNKPIIVSKLPYALETVGEYTNVGFVKPTDSSMLKERMCFLMKYGSFKNEKNWENDVEFEQFNDWNELFNNIIKD